MAIESAVSAHNSRRQTAVKWSKAQSIRGVSAGFLFPSVRHRLVCHDVMPRAAKRDWPQTRPCRHDPGAIGEPRAPAKPASQGPHNCLLSFSYGAYRRRGGLWFVAALRPGASSLRAADRSALRDLPYRVSGADPFWPPLQAGRLYLGWRRLAGPPICGHVTTDIYEYTGRSGGRRA